MINRLKTFAWIAATWALFLIPELACGQSQPPTVSYPSVNVNAGAALTAVKFFPVASFPSGSISATFSNVTGSPSGCSVAMNFYGTTGIQITQAPQVTNAVSVANGTQVFQVGMNPNIANNLPALGMYGAGAVSFVCSTFPTSGTAIFEFTPDIQPRFFPTHISTNQNTPLKTVPAQLHNITINTPGTTETITVYDNTSCGSGTVLAVITPTAAGQNFLFDLTSQVGLCVTTAGTTAGDYTVSFR